MCPEERGLEQLLQNTSLVFPHVIGAVRANRKSSKTTLSAVLGLSQHSSGSSRKCSRSLRTGLFSEKMCAQVLAKGTAISLALPLPPMPNNARKCKN